ncbi:fimbria/pilus outer membrane usher protein [Cupriavidus sp. H39]|uniref:fimbria/pilus outer membrane usher protein n=1 Tax=Cupriavidus sp. H39 TaxID=3401635 RepID=UPI003D04F53E
MGKSVSNSTCLPPVRPIVWAVALILSTAVRISYAEQGTKPDRDAYPFGGAEAPGQRLYLELVVNGLPTGKVVPVRFIDGHYMVQARDARAVSIATNARDDEYVALDAIDGVMVQYESAVQRLHIRLPPDWLPDQVLGTGRPVSRMPAAVSLGMLFNYDIYTSSPVGGRTYTSAWTEQRIFDTWGSISNSGIYRRSYGADNAPGANRYVRYDTSWVYSEHDRLLTYTAGDLITGALPWTSAVRMGGLSIERGFKARPDIVTYPLPQFSGQAAVPTAVDLFINGSKAGTEQANPGPFTLNNVPSINGAGEATVVTTDALGRQVSVSVPFYVATSLLKRGLFTYSVSAGALRRAYGLSSFSYGKFGVSATGRYGLNDRVTLEGQVQGGQRFGVGGAGISTQIGNLGIVSLAASKSYLEGLAGQQYAAGYSYTSRYFSVALRHQQRSEGFRDLADYDMPKQVRSSRVVNQATAAVNLGPGGGTLGTGFFDVRGADGTRTRVANFSYMRGVFGSANLYASLNKVIGQKGLMAQLQLIVPLEGKVGTISAGLSRDDNGEFSQRLQYSRAVPSDGGVGVDLGYSAGAPNYQQASATWRTPVMQVQAGVYGQGNAAQPYTRSLDVQGSLVAMGGGIMAANRIDDAFAVVDTQGYADVPVRYENQLIGKTNGGGRLLVPWAPSYYAGKYEIDPLNLPANVITHEVERTVAVRARSGALISFPVKEVIAADIALVDQQARPLPMGAQVEHVESGRRGLIGVDGATYFENLVRRNHLNVVTPDGAKCSAEFTMEVSGDKAIRKIGPLVCESPSA